MGLWMERAKQIVNEKVPPKADAGNFDIIGFLPKAGWIVAYRDQQGALRGGWDERASVKQCQSTLNGLKVILIDGKVVDLRSIVSIARTDLSGNVAAAWTVRSHGYVGND